MMRLVSRAVAYIERFTIAVENLGFVNAMKLFTLFLLHRHSESVLHVPRLNRDIYFRGVADKGVMSHFFIRGYHIVDTPGQRVRFIVDAGANIGDETIRFRHFHPEATIVALEAEQGNFNLLKKNVNSDPNTVAMLKGLWSHECDLKVKPSGSNVAFSVFEVPAGSGDIQAISIDSLLASPLGNGNRFMEIDILKLDVEGAEYEIFSKNYESWIHKVKVIIVECSDNERPGTVMTMFRSLSGLDFRVHLSGENIVMIRNDVPWKLEVGFYLN